MCLVITARINFLVEMNKLNENVESYERRFHNNY